MCYFEQQSWWKARTNPEKTHSMPTWHHQTRYICVTWWYLFLWRFVSASSSPFLEIIRFSGSHEVYLLNCARYQNLIRIFFVVDVCTCQNNFVLFRGVKNVYTSTWFFDVVEELLRAHNECRSDSWDSFRVWFSEERTHFNILKVPWSRNGLATFSRTHLSMRTSTRSVSAGLPCWGISCFGSRREMNS